MPAYHISGPSTSGKSTVGEVLKSRGYEVIETDDVSGWCEIETGIEVSQMPDEPYPQEWIASHRWLWNAEKINALLDGVGSEPMFFCGGSFFNEIDFYDRFEKRFGLVLDQDTLISRLKIREPERWIDGSAELERFKQWSGDFKSHCERTGATQIDASGTPDEIADAILSMIK